MARRNLASPVRQRLGKLTSLGRKMTPRVMTQRVVAPPLSPEVIAVLKELRWHRDAAYEFCRAILRHAVLEEEKMAWLFKVLGIADPEQDVQRRKE